ncbi:MAG TPA: hypothetical protein VKA85_04880, partial [Candidatus Limnocylindrales bacterium]|nr:hypothetical protein [Candidatus Limnocylindrales bacterium]
MSLRLLRPVIVAAIVATAMGLPPAVLAPGSEYAPTAPAHGGVDGLEGTPPPQASPSPATAIEPPPSLAPRAAPALEPGSVNRSSYNLSVTYDVAVTLHYGDRLIAADSLMTITNTSATSIDRLELNTIAARLGGITVTAASVAGHAVKVATDDQTLVMPLGGVLAAGATVQARLVYRAHLRSDLAGSNWMFT